MKDLLQHKEVTLTVTPERASGTSARDPDILLQPLPELENAPLDIYKPERAYDTFRGLNPPDEESVFTMAWKETVQAGHIVMTMGYPFFDGGWWRTLNLEMRTETGAGWTGVPSWKISPDYSPTDDSLGRRPFEEYTLSFPPVRVKGLRLRGNGGGLSRFVSLSRLEVYSEPAPFRSTLTRNYPIPSLYHLISADKLWFLGNSLYKATGLFIQTYHFQFYLSAGPHREFQKLYNEQYTDPPLWRILNDKDRWRNWKETINSDRISKGLYFQNLFARIHGPIKLNGISLSSIMTYPPVLVKNAPLEAHRSLAEGFEIPWEEYESLMAKMPVMDEEQLDGVAQLIGFIIHEILHHLQHARVLKKKERGQKISREHILSEALYYIEQELESGVRVSDVTHQLGITYPTLEKIFRESYGMTPSRAIQQMKMERAKTYLESQNFRIIDIAAMMGYTENHFIRTFRERFGVSPGQFRKSALNREKNSPAASEN